MDLPPDVRPVAVQLERVTKVFNDAPGVPPVLQDLSLRVASGEFVCLLGASGCGKSTLLNLVAGLESPTSGSIEVPGGRTALMFQESALFPWLTAGKNIELALRLGGVPRAEWKPEIARLLGWCIFPAKATNGCTNCQVGCANAWH